MFPLANHDYSELFQWDRWQFGDHPNHPIDSTDEVIFSNSPRTVQVKQRQKQIRNEVNESYRNIPNHPKSSKIIQDHPKSSKIFISPSFSGCYFPSPQKHAGWHLKSQRRHFHLNRLRIAGEFFLRSIGIQSLVHWVTNRQSDQWNPGLSVDENEWTLT